MGRQMMLTCGQHLFIVFHIPTFLLATGTTHDDIVTVGRVCLHLDVVDTEVAFHPEPGEDLELGCCGPILRPQNHCPLPLVYHTLPKVTEYPCTRLRSGRTPRKMHRLAYRWSNQEAEGGPGGSKYGACLACACWLSPPG